MTFKQSFLSKAKTQNLDNYFIDSKPLNKSYFSFALQNKYVFQALTSQWLW